MTSDYTQPIDYIERTRSYYEALGYGAPYKWAHFQDVPFAPLMKPVSQCNVAIVTSAMGISKLFRLIDPAMLRR